LGMNHTAVHFSWFPLGRSMAQREGLSALREMT
jgi:hypothetical protein